MQCKRMKTYEIEEEGDMEVEYGRHKNMEGP